MPDFIDDPVPTRKIVWGDDGVALREWWEQNKASIPHFTIWVLREDDAFSRLIAAREGRRDVTDQFVRPDQSEDFSP